MRIVVKAKIEGQVHPVEPQLASDFAGYFRMLADERMPDGWRFVSGEVARETVHSFTTVTLRAEIEPSSQTPNNEELTQAIYQLLQ